MLSAIVRVARRDRDRALRVPKSFVEETERHFARTYSRWVAAREANDFSVVADALAESVRFAREMGGFFPGFEHPADALIDPTDPGMSAASLRELFQRLREGLVPRVAQIADEPAADDSCLRGSFDASRQLAFGNHVLERLGMPPDRTRQDLSPHPFMVRIGAGDVRITTRVREDFLGEALFSSMHEAGHALYELGIDPKFTGTPVAAGASAGVHESQSRLVENIVGRGVEFWESFLPELGRTFPSLADVGLEEFVAGVNRVERSLVRTDADEVTYNLHVLARFDLELAMIEDTFEVADLPTAWNERMRSDLGVEPPDDRVGVLQDVHWYSGFPCGAFQGYTLGNLIAAQLFEAAEEAEPGLRDDFRRGDFERLFGWLGQHVHRFGRARLPDEIVRSATGRELGVEAFLAHIDRRFGRGDRSAR